MKLAFFIPSLADGGVSRSVFALAKNISDRGITVEVVTLKGTTGSIAEQAEKSIRFVRLPASRTLFSIPFLALYLRSSKPDVLISAAHYANIVATTSSKLARSKVKLILTERTAPKGSLPEEPVHKRWILPFLMRLIYPCAEAVVAVGKECRDDLASLLGWSSDRIHIIYNPTLVDTVYEKADATLEHPWITSKREEINPIIIGIGRLVPQKGFDMLIKAFALVLESTSARLIILGEGPNRPELEALAHGLGITERVHMPGFETNPYAWMKRAKVFVLSSRYEGLSNALVEAMACGCSVVAIESATGARETLLDGRAGRLVTTNDIQILADAIRETLRQPSSAKQQAAIKESLVRFSPERAADRYLQLIEQISESQSEKD